MNTSPPVRSAGLRRLGRALLLIEVIAAALFPHSVTSAPNDGRLLIRRSALLGSNVAVAIMIDGKPAGTVRRGQLYDKYLTPGPHTLIATASQSTPWQATLNLRAGETYTYTASWNTDKIVLTPVARSR